MHSPRLQDQSPGAVGVACTALLVKEEEEDGFEPIRDRSCVHPLRNALLKVTVVCFSPWKAPPEFVLVGGRGRAG